MPKAAVPPNSTPRYPKASWFVVCELNHSYSQEYKVPLACPTCGRPIVWAVNMAAEFRPFFIAVNKKGNPSIQSEQLQICP